MTTTTSSTIKKLLVLFLFFAGLHYAQDFLIPLSIGAVLATLFLPFCKWMEGKRIPKGLAVLICLLVLSQEQWALLKNQQSSVTGGINFMLGSLTKIFTSFILILVYIY